MKDPRDSTGGAPVDEPAGGEGREQPIRRILVALDASPHSLAALKAAVELADRLDAEMVGLYVEDIHLLQLADLGFAREVSVFTASNRPLDRAQVERQLRSQARQARRAVETLASQVRLRWSFRVAQGVISSEVLAAADETDLVILGKTGWSRRRRMGSTARAVALQAPGLAMVFQRAVRLNLPIGLVFDGSPQAWRAVLAAAQLAQGLERTLTVVLLADDGDQARLMQVKLRGWLREHDLEARFRWLVAGDLQGLKRLFVAEGCSIYALPAGSDFLSGERLAGFLNEVECPVLLVR